jgi:hypothetical protein
VLLKVLGPLSSADSRQIERVEWVSRPSAHAAAILTSQIHHPLHLPTFLSQYNKFWAMDTDRRKQTVHSRWLAMLFIVLCLGAHFGDHEEDAEEEVFLEVSKPAEHVLMTPAGLRGLAFPFRLPQPTVHGDDSDHHLPEPVLEQQGQDIGGPLSARARHQDGCVYRTLGDYDLFTLPVTF